MLLYSLCTNGEVIKTLTVGRIDRKYQRKIPPIVCAQDEMSLHIEREGERESSRRDRKTHPT